MRTKLQIVSVLAASLFSLGMQAQPASTLDEFGGTSITATNFKAPSNKIYTLEVSGTTNTEITVYAGAFANNTSVYGYKYNYTPKSDGKVRFVKSSATNATIYVYEGHKYMGTVTPTATTTTTFPTIASTDDKDTKTGIYDANNLIVNPGFEDVGTRLNNNGYTVPSPWIVVDQPGGVGVNESYNRIITPSTAVEGSHAFLLNHGTPTEGYISQKIGLSNFTTYQFKLVIKANTTSQPFFIVECGPDQYSYNETVDMYARFNNSGPSNSTTTKYTRKFTFTTDGNAEGKDLYITIAHDKAHTWGDGIYDQLYLIAANNEDTGVSGISGTNVTYLLGTAYAPTLTLHQEATEYTPVAETRDLTLSRNLKGNKWNKLCLPFAMTSAQLKATFGDDVRVAEFSSVGEDGTTLDFTDVTSTAANTPYLIMPTSDGTSYTVDNAVIVEEPTAGIVKTIGSYTFKGTYIAGGNVPSGDYYIYENKFYKSDGNSSLKGFRAYFIGPSAAKEMSINVDGTPTSISEINGAEANAPANIYNLNGQLIRRNATSTNSLAKGIYIVKGKKVIVK